MIEHFKKFDGEGKSLLPLSFSHLNEFAFYRERWALRRIFGYEFPTSASAVRGQAVESGLNMFLNGMSVEDASGKMIEEYNKYKKKHGHFTTPEELQEFYLDGEAILDWFKKHKRGRKNYFSKRKHKLKGIEVPLILQPIKERPNIKYMGYVDLIIYDKRSEEYTIFDIKTSTKGWSKWQKGDEIKSQQLYLYKQYYSELFKVPLNKINVEFYIVKRKVLSFDDENLMSPHQAYRVQNFKPTDNRLRLKRAKEDFTGFIRECYTAEGNPVDKEFNKNIDKLCDWCEFGKDKDLCGAALAPEEKFFSF